MNQIDEALRALLESGKEKGYLTYSQVKPFRASYSSAVAAQ